MAGSVMQIVGWGIVLLTLVDIYLAMLYPRSGKGWVSVCLSQRLWWCFRSMARTTLWQRLGVRSGGQCILSFCGPTLLITVILIWVVLLISGFALIVWPALGKEIQITQGETPTGFAIAFYYSGSVLTTLGPGDLVPKTALYRLLALLESALGFSVFTLTITYVLAVYGALTQRNIFALSLHHRTNGSANAAEMLARLGVGGDFSTARQDLADMARNLLTLLESHHSYPVVQYFRFRHAYYALARVVFLAMDTATLIRSALDTERYYGLLNSSVVTELGDGGQHLLVELSNSFLPKGCMGNRFQSETALRDWYFRAVKQLQQAGIATAPNLDTGAELYISLRRCWEPYVMAIADYLAYDWHEIAPAESDAVNPRSALWQGYRP